MYGVLLIVALALLLLYLRARAGTASAPVPTPIAHKVQEKKNAPRPHLTPIQVYAAHTVPILDRSIGVFDALAATASHSSITRIGHVCASYASRVNVLASHLDGVPHPYPWYSSVGRAHHTIIGVYHQMEGAIIECETASSNQDSQGAAQALADIATAARDLHHQDAHEHSLLVHKRRGR